MGSDSMDFDDNESISTICSDKDNGLLHETPQHPVPIPTKHKTIW